LTRIVCAATAEVSVAVRSSWAGLRAAGGDHRGRWLAGGDLLEDGDERAVVAGGLGAGHFDADDDHFDAVDRFQDRGHRRLGHLKLAVADLAQHVLGGMRHLLEPRQPDEAARAFDRVDDSENAAHEVGVAAAALELDELRVELAQHFVRFG
jgi:hypothetical protein